MNPFVHYVQSGQTNFKYLAVFVLRCSCLKYVWQFFNMMHERVKPYYSLCAANHLTCSEINLKWSTCFFFPLSVFCYSGDLFDSVLFTSIASDLFNRPLKQAFPASKFTSHFPPQPQCLEVSRFKMRSQLNLLPLSAPLAYKATYRKINLQLEKIRL